MSEHFQSPDPQPVAEACDSKKSLISGTTSGCGSGDECQIPEDCICKRRGRKAAYETFLKSSFWKGLSFECRSKANFKCSECGIQPGKPNLHSHHLKYPSCWFNTTLDILVCLCEHCHNRRHGCKNKKPRKQKPSKVKHYPIIVRGKLSKREKRRLKHEQRMNDLGSTKELSVLSDLDISRIRSMNGIKAKYVAREFNISRNLAVAIMYGNFKRSPPEPDSVVPGSL